MEAVEDVFERALAIAREVLGPPHVPCARIDGEHVAIGVEVVDRDTGEIFEYALARGDGAVLEPRIVAALGLTAQAEELARRLPSLGYVHVPEPEAPEDIEPEAYEELRASLRRSVALTLVALDEALADDGQLPEDPRTLRRLRLDAIELARAQLAAEATWSSTTDTDRLAAAFAALEARGVATAFGRPSTHSGGWSAVRERADELASRGIEVWGAAFFHAQDVEHALAGHGLCIAFGGIEEEASPDDQRAAEAVLEALRAHGLAPTWSGNVGAKIELKGFAWQRRRREVDAIEELRLDDEMPVEVLEALPQLRALTFDPERVAIARVSSPSVERVCLRYVRNKAQPYVALEIEAALPALRAQVRAQFPKLQTLTVEAGPLRDVTTW